MDCHELTSFATRHLEGRMFMFETPEDRQRIVDLAFDYRGDVTLILASGERIEGYVFDRNVEVEKAYLKLFPKEEREAKVILLDDLQGIFFSGEDTAFGKSWEDWLKKSQKVSRSSRSA